MHRRIGRSFACGVIAAVLACGNGASGARPDDVTRPEPVATGSAPAVADHWKAARERMVREQVEARGVRDSFPTYPFDEPRG